MQPAFSDVLTGCVSNVLVIYYDYDMIPSVEITLSVIWMNHLLNDLIRVVDVSAW